MRDRKTAVMWAMAWWFARRWARRRATVAAAGIASAAASRRSRLRGLLAALALVGVLAGGFLVWRRLARGGEEELLEAEPIPPAETAFEAMPA
jgi:hypothetical protein